MTSFFSSNKVKNAILFLLFIISIALIFKPNYPLVEGFAWVKNPLEGMFGSNEKEGLEEDDDEDDEDDEDSLDSYDSDGSNIEGFESEGESDDDDDEDEEEINDSFVKAMEQSNLAK